MKKLLLYVIVGLAAVICFAPLIHLLFRLVIWLCFITVCLLIGGAALILILKTIQDLKGLKDVFS